jgi:dTDP-4-dehydrorhamnose reductase
MKILVTGGAGYLGAEVARQAVAAGHDVIATQFTAPAPHGRPVRLDLRDDDEVHRCLMKRGPELVVHTAYRQADSALEGDVVRATRNIALASHRAGARLVHVSTDLVFDGEEGAPYAEDAEPRPISPYGQAKLDAEALVRQLHAEALIVRTSLLYGLPDPGPQEQLALLADSPFYVDEIRSPTHAGELAAALLELGTRDEGPRLLHLAGADAISRYELARRLRAAHGHDPDTVTGAPAPLGVRARDVALDSTRAQNMLQTRLRGVREILE